MPLFCVSYSCHHPPGVRSASSPGKAQTWPKRATKDVKKCHVSFKCSEKLIPPPKPQIKTFTTKNRWPWNWNFKNKKRQGNLQPSPTVSRPLDRQRYQHVSKLVPCRDSNFPTLVDGWDKGKMLAENPWKKGVGPLRNQPPYGCFS